LDATTSKPMGNGMSVDWDSLVLVGRVARAHGNKGQVIVNPDTDFPAERFRVGHTVFTRFAGQEPTPRLIVAARFHQGRPVLTLEGVQSMDDAEALAGAELRVPENALNELPEGSYYHHELVGCEVRRQDGTVVGTVKGIEGPMNGSTLVVEGRHGEVLIPLASEICISIDPARRLIVIEPPEGLIELNEKGGWRGRV
jgi:16S rRNA processing protein RimM